MRSIVAFQRRIDRAIAGIDAPMTPLPAIPANTTRILPANVSRLIEAEKTQDGKARRICDFLAGQTDGMVVRTYRRLFDPEFGSFRDLS